jgi:hypothetical protein
VEYLGASLGTQTTYPGPTWLDGQTAAPRDRPRWGFAGEVDKAVAGRVHFLRARGVEPGSPDQERRLSASERSLVGQRVAAALGLEYADAATGFRGILTALSPVPSGRAFAQIVDQRSGRVTVVPLNSDPRRLEGRLVDVRVDASGRSSLRATPNLNRGERP